MRPVKNRVRTLLRAAAALGGFNVGLAVGMAGLAGAACSTAGKGADAREGVVFVECIVALVDIPEGEVVHIHMLALTEMDSRDLSDGHMGFEDAQRIHFRVSRATRDIPKGSPVTLDDFSRLRPPRPR